MTHESTLKDRECKSMHVGRKGKVRLLCGISEVHLFEQHISLRPGIGPVDGMRRGVLGPILEVIREFSL